VEKVQEGWRIMDTFIARRFYNAAGVTPRNDPENQESLFAIDRIRIQLEREIIIGVRVLDLGCGAGRYTFAVEKMGTIPTGIDCANIPLEYARQIAARRCSKATFIEGDVCNLPFGENSFDLALLVGNNIVEYSYNDIDRIAEQLRTILTSGGKLCIGMNDGVVKWSNREETPDRYDAFTGLLKFEHDIPGHGIIPYHTYFWTVGFAKYVISRYLELVREEALGQNRYWIVFAREDK
jgi:SAM-dependent methyltransferase